jgi:hypothetical protein
MEDRRGQLSFLWEEDEEEEERDASGFVRLELSPWSGVGRSGDVLHSRTQATANFGRSPRWSGSVPGCHGGGSGTLGQMGKWANGQMGK